MNPCLSWNSSVPGHRIRSRLIAVSAPQIFRRKYIMFLSSLAIATTKEGVQDIAATADGKVRTQNIKL